MESVKYLFKYIYKGRDRQMVRTGQQQAALAVAERDGTGEYQDQRSIGASEACWRFFQFDMSSRSPAVQPIQVHLEHHQPVLFKEGQERDAIGTAPPVTP